MFDRIIKKAQIVPFDQISQKKGQEALARKRVETFLKETPDADADAVKAFSEAKDIDVALALEVALDRAKSKPDTKPAGVEIQIRVDKGLPKIACYFADECEKIALLGMRRPMQRKKLARQRGSMKKHIPEPTRESRAPFDQLGHDTE